VYGLYDVERGLVFSRSNH